MERSNSFRISLKKTNARMKKEEKKKQHDFFPRYGMHIMFLKGKERVFS
jgi:hypothetical protein